MTGGACINCGGDFENFRSQCQGRVEEIKLVQKASLVQGRQLEFSTQKKPVLGSLPDRYTPAFIAQMRIPEPYRSITTRQPSFLATLLNTKVGGVKLALNKDYTVSVFYNQATYLAFFHISFLGDVSTTNLLIEVEDNNAFSSKNNNDRVWDGTLGSSRRSLQQLSNQQLPITTSLLANVSNFRAMARITDQDKKDAQNGGLYFVWAVFFFKLIAFGVCFWQAWCNPRIRALNQFLRFGVTTSFLLKLPYLNLGFDSYLIQFMDYTVIWDLNLMFTLKHEDNIRPTMKGKLQEYFVPILLFNSIPIQVVLYLLFSIIHIILAAIFKNNKKKSKMVRAIPVLILGFTLVDLVFYSQVSLFREPSKVVISVLMSWGLCVLVLGLVGYHLITVTKNLFTYKIRHRNRGRSVYNKIRIRMEKESARSRFLNLLNVLEPLTDQIKKSIKKGDIYSVLTTAKIIQILVYTTLILHLQSYAELTLILIFAIEFLYLLSMMIYIYLFSFFYRSFVKLLNQLAVECFFFSMLIFFSFFESDPAQADYLFGAEKKYQNAIMFLMWTNLLGEFIYFIIASFHGVRRRGFLTFAANIRRQYDLLNPKKSSKKNSRKPSKKSFQEMIASKAGSQKKLKISAVKDPKKKDNSTKNSGVNPMSLLLSLPPNSQNKNNKNDYQKMASAKGQEQGEVSIGKTLQIPEKENSKETRLMK